MPQTSFATRDAIHALVAAGSAAKVSLVPPDHSRRTSYEPHTTLLPQTIHSAQIEKRTARLLDAIAAISISSEQHQVIAVGVQVQNQADLQKHAGKLVFVLASNSNVPEATVEYIKVVWECMQSLVEHHHELRPQEAKQEVSGFHF
jgi:hypothetical protein